VHLLHGRERGGGGGGGGGVGGVLFIALSSLVLKNWFYFGGLGACCLLWNNINKGSTITLAKA